MKNLSKKEIQDLDIDLRKAILASMVLEVVKHHEKELNLTIDHSIHVMKLMTETMEEISKRKNETNLKEINKLFESLEDNEGETDYEITKH